MVRDEAAGVVTWQYTRARSPDRSRREFPVCRGVCAQGAPRDLLHGGRGTNSRPTTGAYVEPVALARRACRPESLALRVGVR